MPGIVGLYSCRGRYNSSDLKRAMSAIRYSEEYVIDEPFNRGNLFVQRTHLGIVGEETSPLSFNGMHVWVDGEAYNVTDVSKELRLDCGGSLSRLLHLACEHKQLEHCLSLLDGYFAAVIFEDKTSKIHLVSDRLGIKPLYYHISNEKLIFSSEFKVFPLLEGNRFDIDRAAVECFLDIGHLLGDMTWYKDVSLLGPSTILTVDLQFLEISSSRYWSWANIAKDSSVSFQDAAEHLGFLIKSAVKERMTGGKKLGVALSGGLDSRAVFASAIPVQDVCAYTFGKMHCPDVQIARQVSAITGAIHHFYELNEKNWYKNKAADVWLTDGMASCFHFHPSPYQAEISRICQINLNGFSGDLICGGSRIHDPFHYEINKDNAERSFSKHAKHTYYESDFFSTASLDALFINNRVRRFTTTGTVELSKHMEHRKPFISNSLIEFIYSLPDYYRYKSALYNVSLLSHFPQYYQDIPWQKLGCPISKIDNVPCDKVSLDLFSSKVKDRLKRSAFFPVLKRVKQLISSNTVADYTDYGIWLKDPTVASTFKHLLGSENALYKKYTNVDFFTVFLESHLSGRSDQTDQIGIAITLELWLQAISATSLCSRNNASYPTDVF